MMQTILKFEGIGVL